MYCVIETKGRRQMSMHGHPPPKIQARLNESKSIIRSLFAFAARLGNPTQDILEQRFAKMENGAAAMATASGTAACFYAIINLCRQGDNFVSARNLYGGTYTQFNDILPQFGKQ